MRRGCGLNGLVSMKHKQPHRLDTSIQILRPLLQYPKHHIMSWCDQLKIPYIVDETNTQSSVSLRNKVRNEVLPFLLHNDSGDTNFLSSMQMLFALLEENEKPSAFSLQQQDMPVYRKANFWYSTQVDTARSMQDVVAMLKQL